MANISTAPYSTSSSPVPRNRDRHRAVGVLLHGARGGVVFFCEEAAEAKPRRHSLDACSLCRRPLCRARDIFMYRGDTPFCSEECRQEQIELDLAREEEEASYRRRSSRLRSSVSTAVVSPAGPLPVRAAETVVAS